jgi:hypothetical protein
VASSFQLFVAGGTVNTVTLKSGSNFLGAIYAPFSDVTIQANADLFGGFNGRSLTMSGGGNVHYDKALAGATNAGTPWTQTLWIEL